MNSFACLQNVFILITDFLKLIFCDGCDTYNIATNDFINAPKGFFRSN